MPGHTPAERARRLPETTIAAAPALPAQTTALGAGFSQTPIIGRSLFGSGKFSKSEMMKGFRVLSRPKTKHGQTKVASPGVPTKK